METAEYIQIKDHQELSRDIHSKGIANTDLSASSRAKAKAAEARKRVTEHNDAMRDINTLRIEVAEIKTLVTQLIEAMKGK